MKRRLDLSESRPKGEPGLVYDELISRGFRDMYPLVDIMERSFGEYDVCYNGKREIVTLGSNSTYDSLEDILSYLEKIQWRPPSGPVKESFEKMFEEGITFYNWECPVRSPLEPAGEKEFVCSWEDSINDMRIVSMQKYEKRFTRYVRKLQDNGIDAKYYKFLAGTNPVILYPEAGDVENVFETLVDKMQKYADSEIGGGLLKIVNFADVFSEFEDDYRRVFDTVRRDLDNERFKIIKRKLFNSKKKSRLRHCGYDVYDDRMKELTKRICASYAAEEWIIKTKLSKKPEFINPVLVSNEGGFDNPKITSSYLRYIGEEEVPKIFVFGETIW